MPPRGRKAATRSAAAGQTAISFAGKSKITKPSTASTKGKKTKDDSDSVITDITTDEFQTPEAEEPKISKVVIREQVKQEVEQPIEEVEVEAQEISNIQLKKYWNDREKERKAPRVHQEDLSMNEKILRHFDLSSQYGPCIGITRIKRWKRANNLDLHPPIEVLAALLQEEGKENKKAQRAHVDQLMSSRFDADQ